MKKASFFAVMWVLTLGVIEGMARLAYYAIYDQAYARGHLSVATDDPIPSDEDTFSYRILHPYYGYAPTATHADLNIMPSALPDSTVAIGLLGGSVAKGVRSMFKKAVYRHFRDNDIALEPIVLDLAFDGMKQPQQLMIVANRLFLGGEFDIIVNLDGYNEIAEARDNFFKGVFPSFPYEWNFLVDVTADELALIGHIMVLRDEQNSARTASRNFWHRSAAFGLITRFRFERLENSIRALHHKLASAKKNSLEISGPRAGYRNKEEVRRAAVREWYRGSVLLAALAEAAGADYYHFLQPNLNLLDSKPFSAEERSFIIPNRYTSEGYLMLVQFGRELMQQQGVKFFDLTMIFKDNHETLYSDPCCHFNERGYELLAQQMVQRMADSFVRDAATIQRNRRRLAPDHRPPSHERSDRLLIESDWTVSLRREGNRLVYEKQPCGIPADVQAHFFLHVFPVAERDLPDERQQYGYDNRDFKFERNGGKKLARNRCIFVRQLPDYDIAAIRTGQVTEQGRRLWEGEYRFAE